MAVLRSWLFVPGADEGALAAAADCGADVLIQELEDFTAPARRPQARTIAPDVLAGWKSAGIHAAVRVNPLDGDGMDDLAAVMKGAPDTVLLPKTAEPRHIADLDMALTRFEREYGLPEGATGIVPNIESARGLIQTHDILKASPRVFAAGVASEDMATDLGAVRAPDGIELHYVRARFHVECTAAGVMSIDCPYTWRDEEGLRAETQHALRLGYPAKHAVVAAHCPVINAILTPSDESLAEARRIVETFEAAQAEGRVNVELDGNMLELPTYLNAKRLLAKAGE
jgi:citrate lyase subunit beta/citryl-CoA lyase